LCFQIVTILQFKVHMKEKIQDTKGIAPAKTPASNALLAQVTAKEKMVETAKAAYEEKVAAFEQAIKQHTDKTTLKGQIAAAKIAKLTLKIKKIEYKLAKANWKASSKPAKKSAQAAKKDSVKAKSEKTDHKAPKDSAAKGKSSSRG